MLFLRRQRGRDRGSTGETERKVGVRTEVRVGGPAGGGGGGRGGKGVVAWSWGPLGVLAGFGVVAVAGFAAFGQDPARVSMLSESAVRFYAVSFGFFAQAHILLAGAVLGLELWRRARWGWLASLGAVYAVSLGSELLGTSAGVPFGAYEYTSLLGAKWLGLVPVLIPLSWFLMAVPSYGLAARVAAAGGPGTPEGGVRGAGIRVFLGSLLLLAWDLSLDPAMSEVTRYWVWGERGPYYGMPLMNLVGWYVTGLALMGALEALRSRRWVDRVPARWQAAFYGANLLLPLGMSLAAGFWGVAVATGVTLGAVAVWARGRRRRSAAPVRASARVVEAA